MNSLGDAPVRLYCPLHTMLQDFVGQLTEALESTGASCVELFSRQGEVGENKGAKALALGAHINNARRHVREGGQNIVVWPLLGWWEAPLWQHRSHNTLIVMHDPLPVARQGGLSRSAAMCSARLARSRWPQLVTMSPEAYAETTQYFSHDKVHMAPHPMRTPAPDPRRSAGHSVLVLGQYKPERDVDVMATMAPVLAQAGWSLTVAGRNWPAIPGWNVIDRVLSEHEFRSFLGATSVVLLPYQRYFQSGVAVRALEAGVPVVGRRTGFLASILGSDFPGAVENWEDPHSWLAAVEAAAQSAAEQMCAASAYSRLGASRWRSLIDMSSE